MHSFFNLRCFKSAIVVIIYAIHFIRENEEILKILFSIDTIYIRYISQNSF